MPASAAVFVWILFGYSAAAQPDQQTPDQLLVEAFAAASAGAARLEGPDQVPSLPGAWGSSVTLRYGGRVIGRAQAIGQDPDASDELATTLAEAIEEAVQALESRYPIARDRLAIAFGPAIAVDVELAGEPVPMAITSFTESSLVVAPGLEGVLVELEGGVTRSMFPGAMRTARSEPSAELPGLIERAAGRPGLARRPLAEVLDDVPSLRVSKFAIWQMAHPVAGQPPLRLHRGGAVLEEPVTVEALRARAESIAAFLDRVPDGIAAYDPITGGARAASDDEQALHRVLRWLALERFEPGRARELPIADVDRVIGAFGERARGLSIYLRAIRDKDRTSLRSELAALTRERGVSSLASEMPWLGFAAIELGEGQPMAAPVLREFLELARSQQLSADDVGTTDSDLAGGIVFSSRVNPLPDWRTAQVLAFSAAAMEHSSLVPGADRGVHGSHVRQGARFVAQLIAGVPEGHAYVEPSRAMGGVRGALWDPEMRVDVSAISLLSLSAAIEAMESEKPGE